MKSQIVLISEEQGEEKSNAEDVEKSINGLKQEMSGIAGVSIAQLGGAEPKILAINL